MLSREITCTTAGDRIPVRYGQPLKGWDNIEMGWDVEVGLGLGATENKSKAVGERITIN